MHGILRGAVALGVASMACSGAAQAAQLTIDLTSGSLQVGINPPVLEQALDPGFMTSLGFNPGSLRMEASFSGGTFLPFIFRNDEGLGVCSSSFFACLDNPAVDGLGTDESVTFSITNQDPGFEFILVGATFGRVDNLFGPNIELELFDMARLSFGGADYDFDIGAAANSQNPGSCFGLQQTCTVNFVDLLGGGDPFFMLSDSFTFSALGDLDGWYLREVVWEIGLLQQTPEPATLGVLGLALAGLGYVRRRRS